MYTLITKSTKALITKMLKCPRKLIDLCTFSYVFSNLSNVLYNLKPAFSIQPEWFTTVSQSSRRSSLGDPFLTYGNTLLGETKTYQMSQTSVEKVEMFSTLLTVADRSQKGMKIIVIWKHTSSTASEM